MKYSFIFLGALFGFLLSRAGATTYDFYAKLFLLKDLQLLWVISAAVITGFVGMTIFKLLKIKPLLDNGPLNFQKRIFRKGLIFGALIFGIGWGIAGACPGTAPAMLGEGKLLALFAMFGIGLGTYLYGLWVSRSHRT